MATQFSIPTSLNATPRNVTRATTRPRLNQLPSPGVSGDNSLFSSPVDPAIQYTPRTDKPTLTWLHDPSSLSIGAAPRSERRPKHASAAQPSNRHSGENKKPGGSIMGFLTLKEPSNLALEDFAALQRKQAAKKGASTTTVGMPSNSSQKLPRHVPKVNSKWDGLPDSTYRRSGDQSQKSGPKRASTISSTSRRSVVSFVSEDSNTQTPKRRIGSLSSRPLGLQSQDNSTERLKQPPKQEKESRLKRSEVDYFSVPRSKSNHVSSRKHRSQDSGDGKGKTFLLSPSPPPVLPAELPPPRWSSSDGNIPSLQDHKASDYNGLTPPDASPLTPALDAAMANFTLGNPTHSPLQLATQPGPADTAGTFWISDSEEVTVKLAGHGVLKPPSGMPDRDFHPSILSTKDRTKPLPIEGKKVTIITQETEYDSSTDAGASGENSQGVRNFSQVSKYQSFSGSSAYGTSPENSPTGQSKRVPSYSVFPPTISERPSNLAMNAQYSTTTPLRSQSDAASNARRGKSLPTNLTPKERYRLGGKMLKDQVVPWETDEHLAMEAHREKRRSTATVDSGKLRRWSQRLSRS